MSVVPQWFDVRPGIVPKTDSFETLLERTGISPEEVLFWRWREPIEIFK